MPPGNPLPTWRVDRTETEPLSDQEAGKGTVDPANWFDRGREWPVVLVRRLMGDVLRRRRIEQGRTLREVSASARVSLGYLSEVERGRKEASSELLAAICDALDLPMSEVLREVSEEMSRVEAAAVGALTELRRPRVAERNVVAVG
jgi:transcriptional regulator with XRE-family HTH domain